MGCSQYYSRFIHNFSQIAEPLFNLSSRKEWKWDSDHEHVLRDLIQRISSRPVLRPYSPSTPAVLVTDASETGIGAVLEQDNHPVIYISRRLNNAERGYSQTQKEALAVFWAVTRLHKFLSGNKFTIITDHQALQYIFHPQKSLSKSTAAMIQRWCIALSAYDYNVCYKPGKDIPHADFLSRFSSFQSYDRNQEESCLLVQPLPICRSELVQETRKYYHNILSSLVKGWSHVAKKKFPHFYQRREEISVSPDKVLSINDQVIIPPSLRKAILQDLHRGHMGIEKMKSLARSMCWWPEINADIRSIAQNCSDCTHKILNKPKTWTPWPESYQPWKRIHADYCGPFIGRYYALIIIDSYSKWPEVMLTMNASADFTKMALKKCFSREGIPQVLVTDNGTHFYARQLKKWSDGIGCRHLRTAPRHPCSNG